MSDNIQGNFGCCPVVLKVKYEGSGATNRVGDGVNAAYVSHEPALDSILILSEGYQVKCCPVGVVGGDSEVGEAISSYK